MQYYAGQFPLWESRDGTAALPRRVRYNEVTGFFEVLGGGGAPAAYPTWLAALTSLYAGVVTPGPSRPS
jgi:hypothetical protein